MSRYLETDFAVESDDASLKSVEYRFCYGGICTADAVAKPLLM